MTDKTMILLVSGQPMPNLLAAAHPPLGVRSAVLVESVQMATEAERLAAVLGARGLDVRRVRLDDAYDPEPCRRLVHELVAEAPSEFIVNVTGGTKVMAMGAYLAAVERGVRDILYLEHEQGKARWLSSGAQRDNRLPFVPEGALTLDEVLTLHGFGGRPVTQPDEKHVAFARSLLTGASPEAIAVLNALTQEALKRLQGRRPGTVGIAELSWSESPAGELTEAKRWLEEAQKAGLCDYHQGQATFASTSPCKMVGGVWLELATWDAMRRISQRFGISGLRTGVNVQGGENIENEIDVLGLSGRTLYVLECKTARLDSGPVKASDIFYKLDHLRRLGGLMTRLAFVSLDRVRPGQRKRFAEREIHIIDGEAVRDLEGALARWLETDRGVTA